MTVIDPDVRHLIVKLNDIMDAIDAVPYEHVAELEDLRSHPGALNIWRQYIEELYEAALQAREAIRQVGSAS